MAYTVRLAFEHTSGLPRHWIGMGHLAVRRPQCQLLLASRTSGVFMASMAAIMPRWHRAVKAGEKVPLRLRSFVPMVLLGGACLAHRDFGS